MEEWHTQPDCVTTNKIRFPDPSNSKIRSRTGTKSSIVLEFTEKVGNTMFAPVYVCNFFQLSFQQLKFCFVEITTLLFLLINGLWLLCWTWNHQNLCGLSCLLFPCWGGRITQWFRSSHYLGKSWSFLQFFFWAEKPLSIWWSEKEMKMRQQDTRLIGLLNYNPFNHWIMKIASDLGMSAFTPVPHPHPSSHNFIHLSPKSAVSVILIHRLISDF